MLLGGTFSLLFPLLLLPVATNDKRRRRQISRSLRFGPGIRESAVAAGVNMYLTATANTAGVHHRNASDRFHSNGLTDVPSLWFYSKADVVATAEDCAQVIKKWRGTGLDVDEVVFEDTPHVQHLLLEREKYLAGLDAFLAKHRLL